MYQGEIIDARDCLGQLFADLRVCKVACLNRQYSTDKCQIVLDAMIHLPHKQLLRIKCLFHCFNRATQFHCPRHCVSEAGEKVDVVSRKRSGGSVIDLKNTETASIDAQRHVKASDAAVR